eukprot:TRINITY_DN1439_c0_g4_i1.p1 TRINITY_DN1439_c0_g4~~TRINITY_DN1439_c0_g4_i1.p1  ORF type:complete len:696 (-),score=107.68 TRINITY_DN1439_c0_g4_i1:187-2274(-)
MEIRCPSSPRISAVNDFSALGIAEPAPMQRQVSSPTAMMSRQVSWSAPLSRVTPDSRFSTLPRRVMQSLSRSACRDTPQAAYLDGDSQQLDSSADTNCKSEGSPLSRHLNSEEGILTEGSIASHIADAVVEHLKKQLDGMNIHLTHMTEKLLKSVSTDPLKQVRAHSAVSSQSGHPVTPPTLAPVPDVAEDRVESKSIGDSEQLLGPDGSLVPIPVWARRLELSSQDAKSTKGQTCFHDQVLPSVVEDDACPDPPASNNGGMQRQVSPFSQGSGKRAVHFAISEFQHEMQRAAVIVKARTETCDDMPSSLNPGRLPKSVTGAWRRQAAILGRKFREEMEEEVQWQVTKNNMSFYGGLWWMRHITGVRSLSRPRKAGCISSFNIILMIALLSWHLQIESAVPGNMLSSVLDAAMLCSGALALTIHHTCCKLSENCPTTGEQDAMLQSHSLAFGYSDEWLRLSRKQGWRLLCIWLACNAAACASYIHRAQEVPEDSQKYFIATGSLHFLISSTVLCSLCMRVAHICAAMKIALISYMQQFAEPSVDFEDMVQEWNAVQIFIRTLSDGCAPSLACQVAMIPVMVVSALLQMLLTRATFLELAVTITPFFVASSMPYFALVCAADTSMQCEQAAQVANSLLVGQLANPVAQKFLDFMSRCRLGFFINDLRISAGGVMKYTYVLVGVFVTVASSVVESRM